MRDFTCPRCGQHLAFENSVCLSCHSPIGFSLPDMALLVIDLRWLQVESELRRKRAVRADGTRDFPRRNGRSGAVQLPRRRIHLDDGLAGDR